MAGADSVPVPGRWTLLHAVSMTTAGPVDSVRTDGAGRYALRAAVVDTMATYVVSLQHDGIAYFSNPIDTDGATAAVADPLVVYDTSSTEPDIVLEERHVVIRQRGDDGARRVIELLVLGNRGTKTRIAADTTRPVWVGPLPAGAIQFEVGESDVSAETVSRRGDLVAVTAPIPPGQRQILVSYLLPGSLTEVRIPLAQPVTRFNVLVEDTTAAVEGPLESRGTEELDDLVFRRYAADGITAGAPVQVRFAQPPFRAADLWWLLIPIAALALFGGLYRWWRRTGGAIGADDPDVLAARIAALDERFAGAGDEDYRKRRAALKTRLQAALKDRGPGAR